MENGVTLTLSDFSSVVPKAAVNPVGLTRIFGANGGKDASGRNAKSPDGFPSAFPQTKKSAAKQQALHCYTQTLNNLLPCNQYMRFGDKMQQKIRRK